MAAAHIGYVVAFYILASWYGAWAPQELNFDDSVNTAFPWISGAAIGLLASTNEEFTFRLFAIPFFLRFTRSRWIAVIVPAFLWSFLHSNYPQEPPYIRGIEIGIIGIVAGMVMLRWGIIATLIWHYTVDALLVGLLLIRSNSLYFKISGAVVAAAARRAGLRVEEVPVLWAHSEGTRLHPFRDGLRMFVEVLRIRWYAMTGEYATGAVPSPGKL